MAKKTKIIGAKIEVDTSGASKSVGELGKELGSLSPAAKKASDAANLFNNALNIIRANPIIAVVTTLVGVITALFQPFKKMDGVTDALNKTFGLLSSTLNLFINKILTPLIDGFIVLVDVLNNGLTKAFDALGISSKSTSERLIEITHALDDLDDAQKDVAISTAASNRRLQEAREAAANANLPIQERIDALKEAARIEREETQKVIDINKGKASLLLEQLALEVGARENVLKVIRTGTLENLKIARAELLTLKNIDKDKVFAIDALIIAAEDAGAQNAKISKRTQSQITGIEKEEASKRKQITDEAFQNKLKNLDSDNKLSEARLKNLKQETLATAENEQQKLDVEKTFGEKSYQLRKEDLEKKQRLYKKDSVEYKGIQAELIDADTEYVAKKIELSDKQIAIDKKNSDEQQKVIDERFKAQQDWNAFYYKQQQEINDLEQKRLDTAFATNIAIGESWVTLGNSIASSIGNLSHVLGEGSDLAKAFGIAQVAIATASSIGAILLSGRQQQAEYDKAIATGKSLVAIGGANSIAGNFVMGARQIAGGVSAIGAATTSKALSKRNTIMQVVGAGVAGAAQIAAIISAGKSKSAPSVSGGGDGDTGGGVTASAPLSPQPATTILNPEQVNQMGGSGGRAYVIESDISNNQERTARLNRAARIN
jgi:hypothetical protein